MHTRWHTNRGIVHPNCVHCGTADPKHVPEFVFRITDKPVTRQSSHTHWHTNRGLVHPFCVFCGTADGWEPTSEKNPAVGEANRRRVWTPEARLKQVQNLGEYFLGDKSEA